MTFGNPALLWLLAGVPVLLAGYVLFQRRRPRYAVRFTNLDLLASVVPRRPAWRRHLPPALYLLSLAALIGALAQPFATIKLPRQEGTVMLVMDVSGSMDATDVKPSRLRAAVAEAERFVDQLPAPFRVGVVAFSSNAQVLSPPTADRQRVRTALESMRANGGTAMGDGIERALDYLRPATGTEEHGVREPASPGSGPAVGPPGDGGQSAAGSGQKPAPSTGQPAAGEPAAGPAPAAMVLLSDGASNSGQVQPDTAAQDALRLHVPIYTIALGTPGGVLQLRIGGLGIRRIAVPPDPATLQRVAQVSGGRFFSAPSDQDLHGIYQNLATRIGFETGRQDVTPLFIGLALVLLLGGGGLAVWWFQRFP